MQHIRPIPTSHHATHSTHVSKDLSTCTHVFICHNAIRKSLQPPYDGPFKVIKQTTKFYTMSVYSHQQTISLDRLKPAHIDDSPSPTSSVLALSTATPTPKFTLLPSQQPPRRDAMSIFQPNMLRPPIWSNSHRLLVAHWGGGGGGYCGV